MKLRSIAIYLMLFVAVLLAGGPAGAVRNGRIEILDTVEVATGTPVTATVTLIEHSSGYLVIKTENETATASLVVTVFNSTALGDFLICTTGAITTNTTTVILLGHWATAVAGISQMCQPNMTQRVKFVFTTEGAGADFDVSAALEVFTAGA